MLKNQHLLFESNAARLRRLNTFQRLADTYPQHPEFERVYRIAYRAVTRNKYTYRLDNLLCDLVQCLTRTKKGTIND